MSPAEEFFQAALKRGNLGHAWLLEAEDPEERRAAARRIVEKIFCETHEGCGHCAACRALAGNNHPDVIWVRHEKPDTISVGEIRDQLVEDMGIKPYRGGGKLYLVDEAEKMNPQAQNALLKTLEEPPAYGMICLLTNNRNAFLPTVLSRLTVLSAEEPRRGTAEGGEDEGREAAFALIRRLEVLPAAEMAGAATALKAKGMEPKAVLELLTGFLRDLMAVKAGAEPRDTGEGELLKSYAELISDTDCSGLWDFLGESKRRLFANGNPDVVLEVFFLRFRDALRRGVNRSLEKKDQ